ncbi:MAG: SET domain-containing protein-lysine N-methyltransferase [Nanoarchaeota archaeon]
MSKDVAIRDSPIEGKGVYAARPFKKGDIVFDWRNAPHLTAQELKRLDDEQQKYIWHGKDGPVLVPEPERYVNHSCDSNTFVDDYRDIAKRDITRGEEITSDYSLDSSLDVPFDCNCGTARCKKRIGNTRTRT